MSIDTIRNEPAVALQAIDEAAQQPATAQPEGDPTQPAAGQPAADSGVPVVHQLDATVLPQGVTPMSTPETPPATPETPAAAQSSEPVLLYDAPPIRATPEATETLGKWATLTREGLRDPQIRADGTTAWATDYGTVIERDGYFLTEELHWREKGPAVENHLRFQFGDNGWIGRYGAGVLGTDGPTRPPGGNRATWDALASYDGRAAQEILREQQRQRTVWSDVPASGPRPGIDVDTLKYIDTLVGNGNAQAIVALYGQGPIDTSSSTAQELIARYGAARFEAITRYGMAMDHVMHLAERSSDKAYNDYKKGDGLDALRALPTGVEGQPITAPPGTVREVAGAPPGWQLTIIQTQGESSDVYGNDIRIVTHTNWTWKFNPAVYYSWYVAQPGADWTAQSFIDTHRPLCA